MRRYALLPATYFLDQLAGDPEWFPHPVRVMGYAISRGERLLRKPDQGGRTELAAGAALSLGLVAVSYYVTDQVIKRAYRASTLLGAISEMVLGWTCLAARSLEQEANAVIEALESGQKAQARLRIARIVGRDTKNLDEHEISRAVIETLAESASDGIVAPLFYMALGGVPLAMAYKTVNTLDSMIGHADAHYFYFGKVAARLDDVANYLPARVTAFGIIAASHLASGTNPQAAWQTWLRDGSHHKSPNAGQPESAISGSLQVKLGGNNTYAGELLTAETIGAEYPRPTPVQARRAVSLISIVTALSVVSGALLVLSARSRHSA